MPFWDDVDFAPYEQGGISGGGAVRDIRYAGAYDPGAGSAPPSSTDIRYPGGTYDQGSSAAKSPGFDQFAQVGHNDSFNGLNREQYRDLWLNSGVKDIAGMKAWAAEHGGQVLADNGTFRTPYGETMDNLFAAKSGSGRPQWGLGPGGASGGNDPGGGWEASGGPTPAMAQSAVSAATAAGGGGHVGGGNYLPADFNWEKFDPNSVDMSKDPGVAFRISEATKALQNSAAAKGTLFSGGFAKALNDRTQDYASQEYQNAFQRALGVNQANNQGGLATYGAVSGAHLGQGNLDLGFTRAGNDYALGVGQLALGNKTADQSFYLGNRNADISGRSVDNSYSLGQGQLGLGWANYGLNADDQNFNQGYKLAGMGQSGAAQSGSYGSTYGNAAGGYMTGAGNAQAAGQVGASNAWQGAFSGAGTAAMSAYYANKYGRAA